MTSEGWVVDVDGCLVRTARPGGIGGVAFPGAGTFLRMLRARGARVIVCTNASQRPPASYAAHLRELGLPVDDDQLVTAGSAAADHLAAHHRGQRVLVLGDSGITEPLTGRGVQIVAAPDPQLVDAVVVGVADAYTAAAIDLACRSVDAGAALYATHLSPWFHGGAGRAVAVTAAITAAVTGITGVPATVLGKPSPALAATLLRRLGAPGSRVTVVGDSRAEVELAAAMGARSVAVLTGELDAATAGALAPDLVVDDIGALAATLSPLEEEIR